MSANEKKLRKALLEVLEEYIYFLEAYCEPADPDDPGHEILVRREKQLKELKGKS